MTTGSVCILGGTGFVGRRIATGLNRLGWDVLIPTRRRERHRDLLTLPQVKVVEADVHDTQALQQCIEGNTAVINLIGILNESGHDGKGFERAHVELPRKVMAVCKESGVQRVLHMSALNAYPREEHSHYLRTKGEGEDLVHAASAVGLAVTSFRPSVIFGPGDSFFNRFAGLLKLAPLVFPLACPESRFAPVYVDDVAQAFIRSLTLRETIGKHIDLCGPDVYTLRQLVEYTAKQLGLKRRIIGLSPGLSALQARLLEWAPGKPFSRDNYWSLQKDSVCHSSFPAYLGIEPASIDAIVPQYLGSRTQRARYHAMRASTRR